MRRPVVLAVLASVLTAGPAGAAPAPPSPPSGGLSVLPAQDSPYASGSGQFVDLGTVQPGTVLADSISVRNTLDSSQQVLLYAVDGSPALGGGFGYSERGQGVTQLGSWVDLAEDELLVPAGKTVRVRFELRVPAGAEGGTYVGGIAADPSEQDSRGAFGSRTRYVMPIRLVVPGGAAGAAPGGGTPGGAFHLTDLTLRAEDGRICPSVRYRNDSQDVLDPVATVRVRGPFGSTSTSRHPSVGVVAPDGEREAALPCVERPMGPFRVVVTLATPRGNPTESRWQAWLPLPVLLALLLLLLLVLALATTFTRGLRARRGLRSADREGPSQI